jgi:hypothetical protein
VSLPEATLVMAPPLTPACWKPIVTVTAFAALAITLKAKTAAEAKSNLPIFITVPPVKYS